MIRLTSHLGPQRSVAFPPEPEMDLLQSWCKGKWLKRCPFPLHPQPRLELSLNIIHSDCHLEDTSGKVFHFGNDRADAS